MKLSLLFLGGGVISAVATALNLLDGNTTFWVGFAAGATVAFFGNAVIFYLSSHPEMKAKKIY